MSESTRQDPDAPASADAAQPAQTAPVASEIVPPAPVLESPQAPRGIRGWWSGVRSQGRLITASWIALGVLALVAAIQRFVIVFVAHEPRKFVWSDMQGYVDRAWRLADPHTQLNRFDSFYPPGTHVLMAPLMRLAGNKERGLLYNQWLWWVFAVVTLWAVAYIALRLFRHPAAAALCLGLLTWHWPIAAFTGFFMSENPFACLMAVSLALGHVAKDIDHSELLKRVGVYALAGLIAGIGATNRPQFIFGAMTIGLPLLMRRFPFVRLAETVALGGMFVAPCVAAMALNSHAAGVRMGMSGNAGFNFFQGHCDVVHIETHQKGGGGWYAFAAPVRIQRVVREGQPEKKVVIKDHMAWENDYFFEEGFKCIRDDGWAHLGRIYTNVEDLFSPADPWPPNTGKFGGVSSWMNKVYSHALLFIIPIVIYLARYRRPERWLLLQMATVLPVGFMFYGDSRYRVPYDMFGYLMIAGIFAAMLRWRGDERWFPKVGWRRKMEPLD